MKIGVQSGYAYSDADYESGLLMLKEAGFDAVDFNIDNKISVRMLREEGKNEFFSKSTEEILEFYRPQKEAADKAGIEYCQMHAPFPVYLDGCDDANKALTDSVIKSMAVCELFECPYLIVHPIARPEWTTEEQRKLNIDYYTTLIPYAKKYGVGICLENMFYGSGGAVKEAVCSDPHETVDYIDTLNAIAGEEIFSFCFDVGHATLLGKNMRQVINTLGNRIKTLHIHDNDGRSDLHMQPFAYTRGNGFVTEWQGLIDGLRDIGYKGVLSFETFTSIRFLPEVLKPAMLRFIASVGKYMSDEIEK
ncbi:MAG: sugar phosphate isomerase/epimerase [Clostridia bacterium]|nr:sugar phosphate isomerase/epimerase [Clostridia bacterium]